MHGYNNENNMNNGLDERIASEQDTLAFNILSAMNRKKMSRKELAEKVGISLTALQAYVNSNPENRSTPKPETLNKIADALGVSPDWLYGRERSVNFGFPSSLAKFIMEYNPDLFQVHINPPVFGTKLKITIETCETDTDLLADGGFAGFISAENKLSELTGQGLFDGDLYHDIMNKLITQMELHEADHYEDYAIVH